MKFAACPSKKAGLTSAAPNWDFSPDQGILIRPARWVGLYRLRKSPSHWHYAEAEPVLRPSGNPLRVNSTKEGSRPALKIPRARSLAAAQDDSTLARISHPFRRFSLGGGASQHRCPRAGEKLGLACWPGAALPVEIPASKLAGRKAAASWRSPKLRDICYQATVLSRPATSRPSRPVVRIPPYLSPTQGCRARMHSCDSILCSWSKSKVYNKDMPFGRIAVRHDGFRPLLTEADPKIMSNRFPLVSLGGLALEFCG